MRRVLQWHIKLVNNVNLWWSKFKIILEQFYMGNVLLKSRKTEGIIHQYAGRQPVIGYRSRQLNSLFDILKPWWKGKWSIWLPTECLEEGETTKNEPCCPKQQFEAVESLITYTWKWTLRSCQRCPYWREWRFSKWSVSQGLKDRAGLMPNGQEKATAKCREWTRISEDRERMFSHFGIRKLQIRRWGFMNLWRNWHVTANLSWNFWILQISNVAVYLRATED